MKKRKIFYIPMIHRPEELGSFEKKMVTVQEKIFGKEKTIALIKNITAYWELASERIEEAGLYHESSLLHIFVDSLPNEKEELVQATVNELIKVGKIPAYQIIAKLQAAGARVYGTENTALLIKEIQYWKDVADNKRVPSQDLEKELLKARDQIIIDRINETVPGGETAIVFIGRLHNVVGPLSKSPYNFKVVQL